MYQRGQWWRDLHMMYMQYLQFNPENCTSRKSHPARRRCDSRWKLYMHALHIFQGLSPGCTTVTTVATTHFTRPLFLVHESLQHMNSPVQLVGNVIPGGTTRFSAKGKEGLSIVHISFYQGNVQILCTDGHVCQLGLCQRLLPWFLPIRTRSFISHTRWSSEHRLCEHRKPSIWKI